MKWNEVLTIMREGDVSRPLFVYDTATGNYYETDIIEFLDEKAPHEPGQICISISTDYPL